MIDPGHCRRSGKIMKFLPLDLAVPSSKPSGPSVSSSGIYAEAGPDVRVDFINAGLPNPGASNWEFSDISGSAEPGLQGLILQRQ